MRNYSFRMQGKLLTLMLLLFTIEGLAQQRQPIEEKEYVEAHSAYIEGLAAFENNDLQKALKLLTSAYVKLPEHPGVNFALADTYLKINDLENAEYYGKQATKLDPENRWYHLKLVETYRASGQNEAAVKELQNTLNYHPDDEQILYELAQTYSDYGELRKANEIYDKLLILNGETIEIRLEKLKNFRKLGMQDAAIVELKKIRTLDPDNLSTLQILSNYYLEMGKLEEAQSVLQNALQINRRDPKTLIMLSDIYMSEAKWDSVGSTLGSVVSDSTISESNKLQLARYLYSKFESDKTNTGIQQATSTVFRQLIDAEPTSTESLDLAIDFFVETEQNGLALRALEKINKLIPTDDKAWQQRLQLLLASGKTGEAVGVGEQAAEQIPQDPIILYFLGSAYLMDQSPMKAITSLEEAATLPARRPLKSSIWGLLGDAYAASDKWEEAFSNYEKSLKINPDNPIILNNYAYYLSEQKQDLTKAKEMALKAIELDPSNASFLDTAGWIYYQKNEFNKAQEYIQKAIDTGNVSGEILEHMGHIMDKLGKPEEAKKWWRKALEKDSTRTHLKEKVSK